MSNEITKIFSVCLVERAKFLTFFN